MKCPSDMFIHAFVDGELDGVDRREFEIHMIDCADCARDMKAQLHFKSKVRAHLTRPALPATLQAKVKAQLAEESKRAERAEKESRSSGLLEWLSPGRLIPLAAAAAVVVFYVQKSFHEGLPVVLKQAQRAHSTELPLDVRDNNCDKLAHWLRGKVDFTISQPVLNKLSAAAGQCEGVRLVNVDDRFAAYIGYRLPNGQRTNLLVFEGEKPIEAPHRRKLGNRDVYLETGRGATTAAYRGRDGLNYVLTSDLDERALMHAVQASFQTN